MRRLPSLLVAGLLAAAPVVIGAAPAHADTTFQPSGPVSSQPTITGTITLTRTVDTASVTITPASGGSGITVSGCNSGGISCSGGKASFSVPVSFAYNGTYNISAVATHNDSDGALPTDRAETGTGSGAFGLAVPPITPRRLAVTPDGGNRTATLTWQQNPEPDITGYLVYRSTDGGSDSQLGMIPPGSGDTVRFVDDVGDGGQLTYKVYAVRPGGTPNDGVQSATPATASTTVDRIAPTTTAPAGTSGGASGGSTSGATSDGSTSSGASSAPGGLRPQKAATPVRISAGGHVDLSGFKPNPVPLNVGPAPAPPDPGFQETLPYKQPTATTEAAPASGRDEAALPVGSLTTTTETNRRALMAFLAGAMLLFMLSMHLRWLLRRAAPVA